MSTRTTCHARQPRTNAHRSKTADGQSKRKTRCRGSSIQAHYIHRMRLQSLDIFRGMTIVAMILVNFQGDFPAIYPPLAHSTWEGCTLADTVFPCFLFIIGVTLYISMSGRRARGATDG